ncbi:1-deoxy-D-xylulose-5-phosphate synthase [Bacilli bacterium PM5-3]|nr:1-deoxy-D-xylulose-5-phosphate synthase [Bacilli bacterium PM5-3]MDH6603064.1 1-deoxy-D-xylulose-5-phosphate synthase [Bacilli bacterium PM5-9]
MDIENIENPIFLDEYNNNELKKLAKDIRKFLVCSIANTGGHLSSNLGVIELTIALHKVFNAPQDKIFFDVGHQSYIHKILTGRAKDFSTLRTYQGLSGYQKISESEYDCFEGGHSSTTISCAVGMAIARDLNNEKYDIVPVIGDGALSGGMAIEALNHLGHLQKKVIVILNDNEMSISKNVGGLNNLLDKMRISMSYNKAKQNYKEIMNKSKVGQVAYNGSKKIKDMVKSTVISNMFVDMGIDYIGPLDGHDFHDLLRGLNKAKASKGPIVVHVLTKKGKGYKYAENDVTGKWHGIGKFDAPSGELLQKKKDNEKSYSQVVADAVYNEMQNNDKIVTITPAMITGSKLEKIFEDFPDRSFDVGIAEQHATMMAAGLALNGMHPFLSIYSTFSQRSYDQFNHDLSRMDLPVVIGLDRAGIVGEDGQTHHGVFDISLYRNLPNFIISAPKDNLEVDALVSLGFKTNHPFIIRYPRGNTLIKTGKIDVEIGKWETIANNKKKVLISYGSHSEELSKIIDKKKCGLIHARFLKPLDTKLLDKLFKNETEIIIYEPDIKGGGFASSILEYANEKKYNTTKVTIISIDDKFVEAGSINVLMKEYNLAYQDIVKKYCSKSR